MTAPTQAASGFAARLAPLIDRGYRAALLWLGSAEAAEAVVAQAASEVLHLTIAGGLRASLPVVFLQLTVVACTDRGERQPQNPDQSRSETADELVRLTSRGDCPARP